MTSAGPAVRVVLVGFMGSGKSTVGTMLADALGWDFSDLDALIEERTGSAIVEIFAARGEDYFRDVEARVAAEVLDREQVVLAVGGGWAAAEGRLTNLAEGTVAVWLRVSPDEALRRAATDGPTRPLLERDDPLEFARKLLEEREAFYALADVEVDTEGRTPEDVTDLILTILRERNTHSLLKENR